jgi:hypothetical protein
LASNSDVVRSPTASMVTDVRPRASISVLYLAWIAFAAENCRNVIRGEGVAYTGILGNGRVHLPRTPLQDKFIIPRYYPALFRADKLSDLRGG